MILFAASINHDEGIRLVKELFPEQDLDGELHCAGNITVTFPEGGFGHSLPERIIYGASSSLQSSDNGGLPVEKSEVYKQG